MSATRGIEEKSFHLIRTWESCTGKFFWVLAASLLLGCFPFEANAQPKPSWVPSQSINSDDGYGTLRWTVEGDQAVTLFRITEEFAGQQSFSFTDQAELAIFRINSGKYTFKVQACERDADGFPKCGK